MGEIMKTWLRTRLGVIMDLEPEIFGHYTRDGTLLAKILHTYDIITRSQLETITPTQDPALARVNLRLVRVWLRFLGIVLPDDSIHEISRGKGTAALRLFYKLYLCLESKDSLHFIRLQKEREKYLPQSSKFDMSVVPEDPPSYEPTAHPLSKKLCEQKEAVVEWHRPKLLSILRKCKQEREKFAAVVPTGVAVHPEDPVPENNQQASKEAAESARKDRGALPSRREEYKEDRLQVELAIVFPVEEPRKAKLYVDDIKKRRKQIATAEELKSRVQKSLLSEILESSADREVQRFDEVIARRVLDQSRYEKQIMAKLCEVREQKSIIVENQRIVGDLMLKAREQEHSMANEREKDKLSKETEQVASEYRRLCELHCRIRDEKMKKLREKDYRFCLELLRALVDMSLRIIEYRQANTEVPRSLWCQWKSLFVKGQPLEEVDIEEILDVEDEEEEIFEIDLEQADVIRDLAFEEYLRLDAPWDKFAPDLTDDQQEVMKLGVKVLGYVVHRLLQRLHSSSTGKSLRSLAKPEVVALVLGIGNHPALYDSTEQLLDECGIRLIRMEDAINHCLAVYRSEVSDFEYIDLNIIKGTDDRAPKKDVSARKKTRKDRSRQTDSKTEERTIKMAKPSKTCEEKESQTPRTIPFDDMDPVLSNTAYIGRLFAFHLEKWKFDASLGILFLVGKWTYEFLTVGQPISNQLLTQVLLEYLKSLNDCKGWAILDYPRTYEQMALMEQSLTGRRVSPDLKPLPCQTFNIEEVNPISPRIVFERKASDSFIRQSNILPNPIKENDAQDRRPVFPTIYIKVMPKPKNLEIDVRQSYEVLSTSATPVDIFYSNQNRAYAFYYSIFDIATLSRLAKLIACGAALAQTSKELYQDVLEKLEGRLPRSSRGDSKLPIIRRLVSTSSYQDITEAASATDPQGHEDSIVQPKESNLESGKPGESSWQWIDQPLPSVLMETLATIWENLERTYIETIKEMLYLKSIHASSILPYADFIRRKMKKVVEKCDGRQEFLAEFQQAFNSIDEDARDDTDVKCELHRRVADFQARLWDMSDLKREEAENERRRIIDNQWAIFEIIALFNVYTGLLQAELDRSIDTLHVIQDYYTAVLQKPLQDYASVKRVLPNRLDFLESREESEERPLIQRPVKPQLKSKSSQGNLDRRVLEDYVTDLLANVNEDVSNGVENPVYKALLEQVKEARSSIDSISSVIGEVLKKESAVGKESPRKKAPDGTGDALSNRTADLIVEWQWAFNYEVNRVRFQLQVLTAAAQADIISLIEFMRKTFRDIYNNIVERYKNEIKSINEMANAFCFAIEDGKAIEEKVNLLEDRFIVRGKDQQQPASEQRTGTSLKELGISLNHTIELCRLTGIFHRIAPKGSLSERSFIHLLQDMVRHGEESGVLLFPCSWYHLTASDIGTLVHRLFGRTNLIQWREFIIYMMNLPMPSPRDILIAREQFRKKDPSLRETVTIEQFHSTPLWFLDSNAIVPAIHQVLRDNLAENSLDFFPEKLSFFLEKKELSLLSGENEDERERGSRQVQASILAKEILCQMFLTSKDSVNYTAMLLAFCKDSDPSEGFGKALTLAVGNIICTNWEIGEAYIDKLRGQIEEEFPQQSSRSEEMVDQVSESVSSIAQENTKPSGGQGSQGDELISKERLAMERSNTSGEGDVSKIFSIGKVSTADSFGENIGELFSSESDPGDQIDKYPLCYWVPRDICLTVLAATLPSHLGRSNLFGNSMSLKEAVESIYEELWDEGLNPDRHSVPSHRLLRHDLILKLLNNTSNFKDKRPGDLIDQLVREGEQPGHRQTYQSQ